MLVHMATFGAAVTGHMPAATLTCSFGCVQRKLSYGCGQQHIVFAGCVCLSHRYACYLVFQLRTHHDLFCGEDEDEEPVMTFPGAIAVLTGITVTVAICSE